MFDKLIESNSEEAEFKPRRKFFMVSSVVVGILFLSAVVFSLYAQNIDLGTDNFELVEMLAPVANDEPQPKPPRQQPQQPNQSEQTQLPNRNELIARVDQPTTAPTTISTTRFTGKTMPYGDVTLSAGPETDGYGPAGPSANSGPGESSAGTNV